MGVIKVCPIGLGYTYYKSNNETIMYSDGYFYLNDNFHMLTDKFGAEYEKENLFIDRLSLVAGAFYTTTYYTGYINYDSRKGYYSYDLNYKPKGFEFYTGVDYGITENFIIGAKVGYNKPSDNKFKKDTFYNQKGATFKLSFDYKF